MAALPTTVPCAGTGSSSDEGDDELFVPNRPSNFLDAQWYQQLLDGAGDLPSPQVPSTDNGVAAAATQTAGVAAGHYEQAVMAVAFAPAEQGMVAANGEAANSAGHSALETAPALQAPVQRDELKRSDAGTASSTVRDSSNNSTSGDSNSRSRHGVGAKPCSNVDGASTADAPSHACSNDSGTAADTATNVCSIAGSKSSSGWGSRSSTGSNSSRAGSNSSGGSNSNSGSSTSVLSLDSLPAEDDLDDLLRRLQAGTAQLDGGMTGLPPGVSPFESPAAEQLVSPRLFTTAADPFVTRYRQIPYVCTHNFKVTPTPEEHQKLIKWYHSVGLQQNVAVLVRPTVFVDLRQDGSSSASSGSGCGTAGTANANANGAKADPARQGLEQGLWASDSESDEEDWWAMRQQLRKVAPAGA